MNPKYPTHPHVGVGAVVFNDNRVLLVRRGRPPGKGLWAIPGGRVQLGETLKEAAEREVFEETAIVIRAGAPVFTFDLIDRDENGRIRYHYVVIDLAAEFVGGTPKAGDDALEARWISRDEIKTLEVNAMTQRLLSEKFKF